MGSFDLTSSRHLHAPAGREQLSIPVDQDLLCGLLGSGGVVGAFDEFAVVESGAGADERDEVGALTARQRDWAASISL